MASFIDGIFQGHMVLLGCEHIQGHHTADPIYQKYENGLKYWNVDRCVIRVINDMIKAFNLFPATGEEASTEHDEEEEEGTPVLAQVQVEEITSCYTAQG
ncbi:hypothetical protein AALO_G00205090%2C partial [Scomber scombrus]|uniref:Uncharacterized protein n=1 Tax=Scomber scombrus TaxID=13677 RepID=A0AAV1QCF9_SCOSC